MVNHPIEVAMIEPASAIRKANASHRDWLTKAPRVNTADTPRT